MDSLDRNDLTEAGWQRGGGLEEVEAELAAMIARGVSGKKYQLKLLRRKFGGGELPGLRKNPMPMTEAVVACSEDDTASLAASRKRMREVLRSPVAVSGALMPDTCPVGPAVAAMPVGGVLATQGAIVPGGHGSDICCSMHATFFESDAPVGVMLDAVIDSTRFGPGGRAVGDRIDHPVLREQVWGNRFLKGLEDHAARHLADQGDGNHFAFVGEVEIGSAGVVSFDSAGHGGLGKVLAGRKLQVLVTHHGSRGLGAHLYERGQKAAIKETAKQAKGIPDDLAWLDASGEAGKEYWEALQYAGRWTKANHESIHERFLQSIGSGSLAAIGNAHNFVWKRGDLFLHGKGATPAWRDDEGKPLLGLIPLNMGSPILLTVGSDNSDYLSFAPHGAGRNRSRRAVLREYFGRSCRPDAEVLKRVMDETTEGLDIRWYSGRSDLSELPVGYRSATQVREQIEAFGLAEVVAEIQPLGCVMAGDTRGMGRRREDELTPKQLRQIDHRAERRKGKQRLGGDFFPEED